MQTICDIAFDAVDEDGSGGLDQEELREIMVLVSDQMGITPPSAEDVAQIMKQLDETNDGVIDK